MEVQRHLQWHGAQVIGFTRRGFVEPRGGIGDHQQLIGTLGIHRQQRGKDATRAGSRCDARVGKFAEFDVRGIENAIARQVHPVDHARRVSRSDIAGCPLDSQRFSALDGPLDRHVGHSNVRVNDGNGRACQVVRFALFIDEIVGVGDDFQMPCIRCKGRNRETERLRIGTTRIHFAVLLHVPQAEDVGAGIDQANLVHQPGIGGFVAGVPNGVAQGLGLAHLPDRRQLQVGNLHVGLGQRMHQGWLASGRRVVGAMAAAVANLPGVAEGIRLDDEMHRPAYGSWHGHIEPGGIGIAGSQGAHMGQRAQQHRLAIQCRRGGQINLVHPQLHIGCDGSPIGHRPFHARASTRRRFEGYQGEYGRQVRIRRRDADGAGCTAVVAARIRLQHLARGIGGHAEGVVALYPGGKPQRRALAIGITWAKRRAVGHLGEKDVVAIADHAVAGQDDTVDPPR